MYIIGNGNRHRIVLSRRLQIIFGVRKECVPMSTKCVTLGKMFTYIGGGTWNHQSAKTVCRVQSPTHSIDSDRHTQLELRFLHIC